MKNWKFLGIIALAVLMVFTFAFVSCDDGTGDTKKKDEVCNVCGKNPCECPCEICGTYPCSCEKCPTCQKPVPCPDSCPICEKHPCECPCMCDPDCECGGECTLPCMCTNTKADFNRIGHFGASSHWIVNETDNGLIDDPAGGEDQVYYVTSNWGTGHQWSDIQFFRNVEWRPHPNVTSYTHFVFEILGEAAPEVSPAVIFNDFQNMRVMFRNSSEKWIEWSYSDFRSVFSGMNPGWAANQWVRVELPIYGNPSSNDGTVNEVMTALRAIFIRIESINGTMTQAKKLYIRNLHFETKEIIPTGNQGGDASTVAANMDGNFVQLLDTESSKGAWGVTNAPGGDPAYYVFYRAPDDVQFELKLNEEQNFTGYDYFQFDLTADSVETLEWISGGRTRFRKGNHLGSNGNDWSAAEFDCGQLYTGVIAGAKGNFATQPWCTVKVPISERAGWNLQGNGGSLGKLSTVDNVHIWFFFDRGKTGNTADKIYIKNVTLIKDDGLDGNISYGGIADVNASLWNVVSSTDPYEFSENWASPPAHQWSEIRFYRAGNNFPHPDARGKTHFVFEIKSIGNNQKLLNMQNLRVRFRNADEQFIEFNYNDIRGLFSNHNPGWPTDIWVTVELPIGRGKDSGENPQFYDSVMSAVRATIIRIESTNSAVSSGNIGIRNMRFETVEPPVVPTIPDEILPKKAPNAAPEGSIAFVPQGIDNWNGNTQLVKDKHYSINGTNAFAFIDKIPSSFQWNEMNFYVGNENPIIITGGTHFVFDIAAESQNGTGDESLFLKVSEIQLRLYPSDGKGGSAIMNYDNVRGRLDDDVGSGGWTNTGRDNCWIPLEFSLKELAESSSMNDVFTNGLRRVQIRLRNTDQWGGAPTYRRFYISNMRVENRSSEPDKGWMGGNVSDVTNTLPGGKNFFEVSNEGGSTAPGAFGVGNAPDGTSTAYYIYNIGPDDAEINFVLRDADEVNVSSFSHFAVDIAADSAERLKYFWTLTPRMRSKSAGWKDYRPNGDGIRALADAAETGFNANNWYTLEVPLSATTADQIATVNALTMVQLVIQHKREMSEGANPIDITQKVYFKNFRFINK